MPKEQTIQTNTIIVLDFWDKIRILFGRPFSIKTTITIPQENEVPHFNARVVMTIGTESYLEVNQDKPMYGYTDQGAADSAACSAGAGAM